MYHMNPDPAGVTLFHLAKSMDEYAQSLRTDVAAQRKRADADEQHAAELERRANEYRALAATVKP